MDGVMAVIKLIVNTKEYEVIVDAHDTLAKVLREKIQLTRTKLGCEQGSCGSPSKMFPC